MTAQAAVLAFVDARRGELVELCRELVAAPSVNPPGRTVEAAAALARFLDRHGLAVEEVARDPAKPNLVARADGRDRGRHLVLNGHLDTISPGDEGAWSVPRHALTEHVGRLHGLGMGNMKGGLAALALAFAALAEHRAAWSGAVTFTAVADETVFGADGAVFLLETRPEQRGDALLCGEGPGFMELAVAEKGLLWVAAEALAEPGQGMLATRGSSAIARLAGFLAEADGLNDRRVELPTPLDPGEGGHGARLSVNLGTVAGGRFVSQAADRATAEIDLRLPLGLGLGEVESWLARIAERHGAVRLHRIKGWEANGTAADAPIARAVAEAAAMLRGKPPRLVVRLPASDASRWRALGVPAVCYGPQPTLAAGIDDFARVEDVLDCARVYALAALRYLDGQG